MFSNFFRKRALRRSLLRAPLFEEIRRYARQPLVPFHTPGHKAGRGLERDWEALGFPAKLDLTEIPAFQWAKSTEEAEELAARFFRADQTVFLTQGASQGIIGGILGAFSPGDKVLVLRSCHGSVIRGIILAGLRPVFVEAEFLPGFNIPAGIHMDSLRYRIRENPDCKGLIITNPSYQGVAVPMQAIREVIGRRILMVDEAHGGHFQWMGFKGYNAFDVADIWVHGTHKILGSLTQTGMLHIKEGRVDPDRIKAKLALITTTSPSYILLASLDSSRRWLETHGARLFFKKMPYIRDYKNSLARLEGVRVLTEDQFNGPDEKLVDPWKICIHFQAPGLTGCQADRILRKKYRIQSEYADISQITFLVAPWQAEPELDRLKKALKEITSIKDWKEIQPKSSFSGIYPDSIPPLRMTPREAAMEPGELIPLEKAAGRIAAAIIAAYPPGIPLVVPGELISLREVDYIREIIAHHGLVNGVDTRGMVWVTRVV